MKVNELQIGDWVHYWILDIDAKINDIMNTGRLGIIFTDSKDEVRYIHGIMNESIKLIPLTAEILEKNGFNCEEIIQPHWISEDGRILLRNDESLINSNNKWSVHVDNEDMQTIGYFELTYVHQLQHLLRLCEIKKEVEI